MRVNRDTLIMTDAVVAFTCDKVQLIPAGIDMNFYKGNKQDEVFRYLCEQIPSKQIISWNNNEKKDLEEKNGSIKDKSEETGSLNFVNLEDFTGFVANDKDKISICKAIINTPSANVKKLAEMVNIPYRTTARKLKYLKEKKIIQYQGAQKNGGYVLSPFVTEEVKKWLLK